MSRRQYPHHLAGGTDLVIDNFEQVIDAARIIAGVLPHNPNRL